MNVAVMVFPCFPRLLRGQIDGWNRCKYYTQRSQTEAGVKHIEVFVQEQKYFEG